MKPRNIAVRTLPMLEDRHVFEVTFTVSRVMPGATVEAVKDQAEQVRLAVEDLDVDMGDKSQSASTDACRSCGMYRADPRCYKRQSKLVDFAAAHAPSDDDFDETQFGSEPRRDSR